MNNKTTKSKRAFTLIELTLAMTVLVIVVIGAAGYEYYAVRHMRIANSKVTATRIVQLVIEHWKSTGGASHTGPNSYTPENFNQNFIPLANGWNITIDNLPLFVTLSSSDIATDTAAGVKLRSITVRAKWRADFADGPVRGHDPSVLITTYLRRDG